MPNPRVLAPVLVLMLAACGSLPPPTSTPSLASSPSGAPASPPPSGGIVPAPGSASELYRPNPKAITVAIDPGHGGCLDWGVPDPLKRGPTTSEKAMTLGIGLALRELLEAQGVTVVMTRDSDVALAGDDYPQLNCPGPAWRDVDGDGRSGFETSGRVRTRDELQARIDLANLARADVLVSIHINSPTENGAPVEIAFSETYYDDETPWGVERSAKLAELVQAGVAGALQGVPYQRQDRGTEAKAFYLIARQWAAGDTCQTPGDTWCSPHRGLQAPGVLSEVGSISLRAEQDLLLTDAGQRSIAEGIEQALARYFGARPLSVRYDALIPGGEAGAAPPVAAGDGPPFRAVDLPPTADGRLQLPVRLTNNGTQAWPTGLRLEAGWQPSDAPYLASAPAELTPLDVKVPALEPGASAELDLPLSTPGGTDRQLLWLSLFDGSHSFSDLGSTALQLSTAGD